MLCLPQNTFWIKRDIPPEISVSLSGCLRGEFQKTGKIFSRSVSRTYYLFQNNLLYSKVHRNYDPIEIKGYVVLTLVYVDFFVEGQTNIIRLIQGNNIVQLMTKDSVQYLQWKESLSNRCILQTFLIDFKLGPIIGKGSFSNVHLCQRISDEKHYAVKIIQRSSFRQTSKKRDQLINEIITLRDMNHPNILKLFRIYDSKEYIYLVTEVLTGGTLIQNTKRFKTIKMNQLRQLMRGLLQGLAYIHEKQIIHRDIKPENILFKNQDDITQAAFIDFGLAALVKYERFCYFRCGSPGYCAPEIISYIEGKKLYTAKCDIYSLGVTFFIIFFGFNPFKCEENNATINRNQEAYIDYPKDPDVPQQAYSLLQNMLKKNPKERFSAVQALDHPFFIESLPPNIEFQLQRNILTRKQFEQLHTLNHTRVQNSSLHIPPPQSAFGLESYCSNSNKHIPFVENKLQQIQQQTRNSQKRGSQPLWFFIHESGERPKSNTTGQAYYQFVQEEAKDGDEQFQSQQRSFKVQDDQQSRWLKISNRREVPYKIAPIVLTSDNLSTVHSHDPADLERSRLLNFTVQVTPFQKFKYKPFQK